MIKFSKDYIKLPLGWNGKEVQLLACESWKLEKLSSLFLDYDTLAKDGTNYPLPKKGLFILLVFFVPWARNNEVFTTLRRSTESKWDYYHDNVGKYFTMEKTEEKVRTK